MSVAPPVVFSCSEAPISAQRKSPSDCSPSPPVSWNSYSDHAFRELFPDEVAYVHDSTHNLLRGKTNGSKCSFNKESSDFCCQQKSSLKAPLQVVPDLVVSDRLSYPKPLVSQHSSPSLHKPSLKGTLVTAHPKLNKKFTSKGTRLSPSESRYSHQYSRVPKSDSAYSEEPYSYSPLPRETSSPSDGPYSYSQLPSCDDSYLDFRYPYSCGIPRSDSAYSEQCAYSPQATRSSVPKSHSTILRSDSAFSDIEYSYSTIPQFDSCHLDAQYSCSSLPKSESTFSENLVLSSNSKKPVILPRSFSSYSHHFNSYVEDDYDQVVGKENYLSLVLEKSSKQGSPTYHNSLVDPTNYPEIPVTTHLVAPKSPSITSFSSNSSNAIMPTLKSWMKPLSFNAGGKRDKKQEGGRKISDLSMHSLKLLARSSSPQPQIKKSQTVLALSSNSNSQGSLGASTKLLPKDHNSNSCFFNSCLGKSLKHSISQTLNQSLGHNLNLLSSDGALKKRSRRRSQLSSFLPSSLSLSPAASTTSVGGSFVTAAGGESDLVYCRLCLMDVPVSSICQLSVCQCRFCHEVSFSYLSY